MLWSVCCLEIVEALGHDLWGGCILGSHRLQLPRGAWEVKVAQLVNFVY